MHEKLPLSGGFETIRDYFLGLVALGCCSASGVLEAGLDHPSVRAWLAGLTSTLDRPWNGA